MYNGVFFCHLISPVISLGVLIPSIVHLPCCFCPSLVSTHQALEEESESDSDDISCSSVSDSSDEEVRLAD